MNISIEFVKQNKCMRRANININSLLKWEEPKQEVYKSAIRLFHKLVMTEASRNDKVIETLKIRDFMQNRPKKSSKRRH